MTPIPLPVVGRESILPYDTAGDIRAPASSVANAAPGFPPALLPPKHTLPPAPLPALTHIAPPPPIPPRLPVAPRSSSLVRVEEKLMDVSFRGRFTPPALVVPDGKVEVVGIVVAVVVIIIVDGSRCKFMDFWMLRRLNNDAVSLKAANETNKSGVEAYGCLVLCVCKTTPAPLTSTDHLLRCPRQTQNHNNVVPQSHIPCPSLELLRRPTLRVLRLLTTTAVSMHGDP